MNQLNWTYGITTVESRIHTYLPITLDSLKRAGFDKPILFFDGSTNQELERLAELRGLEVSYRSNNVKTYANWLLSLAELFFINPLADRIAIFQDDCLSCIGLRKYLESMEFPDNGYWNLYSFPQNERSRPNDEYVGWYQAKQKGVSALGLVFNRQQVIKLLSSKYIYERVGTVKPWHKHIDVHVGKALRENGIIEYVHYPCLLFHIGKESSMKNAGYRDCKSFPGEDFDCTNLLVDK